MSWHDKYSIRDPYFKVGDMTTRRGLLLSSLSASAVVALSGCGYNQVSLRYRLTVEVDTPQGLKSGFSVIEIYGSENPSWVNPEGRGSRGSHKGEAVYVELPNGQNLFALLTTQQGQPDATQYPLYAFEDKFLVPTKTWSESIQIMKSWKGQVVEMTSTQTSFGDKETVRVLPKFVSFADIDNPRTIRRVKPFDFAAVFGAGYNLRRVTVAVTDEPITRRLRELIPWVRGDEGEGIYPVPLMPSGRKATTSEFTDMRLTLPSKGDFVKGTD